MLTVELRPYQEPAIDKFLACGNLLLTMEMGTGKTVTSLGAAEELLGGGQITTCLIVAPKSLMSQWAASIAAHTDVETRHVKVRGETLTYPTERWALVVDGTPAKKKKLIAQAEATAPSYVIASYDTVAAHSRAFKRIAQMVIIDEATVLRSLKAARAKALRSLMTPWRLALTGTPVENRPEDAWAIMAWVDPDLFGDHRSFEASFIRRNHWGRVNRYVNLPVLYRKLATASYRKRRFDPDVAPFMPVVDHQQWLVEMDPATEAAYQTIMRDLAAELESAGDLGSFDVDAYYAGMDESAGAGRVMAVHQAAQMLLDDPRLLRSSESAYAAELVASGALDEVLAIGAVQPKLSELKARVSDILAWDGTKVIVVSRYRGMLSSFEAMFDMVVTVRYDGQMSAAARAAAVEAFETNPKVRVLFMSHAGAYGLDLPAATHLIHYDPARSAGQYEQISSRHVRASSEHTSVVVADLIVDKTIEKRTYEQLHHKKRILHAVADGQGIDESGGLDNTVESLARHVRAVAA